MQKTKINLSFLFVGSTLITLIFMIFASYGHESALFSIIAFPFYILSSATSHNTHDPYGAVVGAGIFLGIFGPVVVFIGWIIVLYILQYLYYTLIKKQTVVVRGDIGQKREFRTRIVLIFCILAVIAMDVFFVLHQ